METRKSWIALLWIPVLLVGLQGCGPTSPSLEELRGSEWVLLGPVGIDSMSGRRRGAEVEASGIFRRGRDRIQISMVFVLGPPARFVAGQHVSQLGPDAIEGPVSAESITFLGGQNTEPSIGGVFILENPNDGMRYRLRFPPTRLAAP